MFRELRRKKQEIQKEICEKILREGTDGVLSVIGDDGYPYGVPVNYLYEDGKLYFHGAKVGHKIEAIKGNSKVSFTVVARNDVVKEEYTCIYQSVILFGKARVVEDLNEIHDITERIALRFYPEDTKEHRESLIEGDLKQLGVVEIEVEHLCGKQHMKIVG